MRRVPLLLLVCSGTLHPQTGGDCTIDGVVVNAITGEPTPRAHVTAMGPRGQSASTSDGEGRWNFTGLACGQTQMIATRPGFLQGALGQPRIGAIFRPLLLASGSPVHDARIALSPQSVVIGKVIDDQGDPMM